MSIMSGVSSSSALSWSRKMQATSASSSTSSTQSPGGNFQSKIDTALSDQGITGTKLSDLRTQIQDAVDKAKSGSDGTTDDRDAVKSAVDGVLKDAGVDMDKFQRGMKSKGGRGGPRGAHGPHGPHGAGGPKGPPPSDASSSDTDGDSSTTSGTSSATASSFDAYLKSSGIDPDQFKNSMIASLQSGSTDFSSAFGGASVGSSVDLVA